MNNEKLEVEQEVTNDKRKREVLKPATYDINGMYGVKIDDSDTMTLQKKVRYQDGTEDWIDDGYFQDWTKMFKEVLSSNPKAVALRHGDGNILDLINIIRESNKQVEQWFAPKLNK